MDAYKPAIVSNVQVAICGMNDIVVLLLQRDRALTSDILEQNYSETMVQQFLEYSQAVVDVSLPLFIPQDVSKLTLSAI